MKRIIILVISILYSIFASSQTTLKREMEGRVYLNYVEIHKDTLIVCYEKEEGIIEFIDRINREEKKKPDSTAKIFTQEFRDIYTMSKDGLHLLKTERKTITTVIAWELVNPAPLPHPIPKTHKSGFISDGDKGDIKVGTGT
jgi:hypothetical protein